MNFIEVNGTALRYEFSGARETLAAVIGSDCNLDLLIADIRDELRLRP
jgi:hypothetical protein